jgi:hypothetical protein
LYKYFSREITWLSNLLKETTISFTDMFETLIQQALNWEGGVVFIPLAFGLAVGLGYVIISAARHKKGT